MFSPGQPGSWTMEGTGDVKFITIYAPTEVSYSIEHHQGLQTRATSCSGQCLKEQRKHTHNRVALHTIPSPPQKSTQLYVVLPLFQRRSKVSTPCLFALNGPVSCGESASVQDQSHCPRRLCANGGVMEAVVAHRSPPDRTATRGPGSGRGTRNPVPVLVVRSY